MFRKGYKQIFTAQFLKTVTRPTVNHPPTYSLIDAEKEKTNGKFYEKKKCILMENKADYDKDGQS